MDPQLYDILIEAMKIIVLCCIPLVIANAVSGMLLVFFQIITSTQEASTAYAVRMLTTAGILYIMFPSLIKNIFSFALKTMSP
jgi:type III secretory pathway component EscS